MWRTGVISVVCQALAQAQPMPLPGRDLSREVELGRRMAEDLEKRYRVLADPVVSEYFQRLGRRLTQVTADPLAMTFRVLDDGEALRMGMPGGYIYFSSAEVRNAASEHNLAARVGHQIAHLVRRHGRARRASAGLGAGPVVILGARPGGCSFHRYPELEKDADEAAHRYVDAAAPFDASKEFEVIKARLQPPPRKPPTLRRIRE
jgi:predicted Zn-dependent protease